ncbi:minor tail protein [Gordonia phage BobBob]|uniref:Minor tail protein n=1 Tax=Gordonia phage Rofo TaxID=2250396 RepID=A0A345KUB3_9CAUD|nr:minor tail protein [Gordonia phage Rofo]AXH46615.1 minor tail protein [Gordonia phage Rofo]UVF60723.1 minor tail protein [Gordonia phage BobBob]
MTAPNLTPASLADYDDVANAVGIAESQAKTAQSWIDEQVARVAGEVNGVVGWITDGLETVISSIVDFMTTGETRNLQSAAAFIHDKISDFVFDVIENLQDLWKALTSTYEGDDEWLLNIQAWRDSLFGWIDDVADFIQNLLDAILRGIRGIPVVGGTIADIIGGVGTVATNAQDAVETAVSVGIQVNYVQQVIALQSGMGVHETGPDRTGTPSFNFGYMNRPTSTISHDLYFDNDPSTWGMQRTDVEGTITLSTNPSTISITASYAAWANVIFKSAAERKVLTWEAYKSGTVSSFNVDVYKLEADGSSTWVYSSPNLAGDVPVSLASIGWMQHLMDGASIIADVGDVYDVQFRMTGSGTVFVTGLNFHKSTPLPGFRPYTIGSGRNPSSDPAPAVISTAARDAMYTGPAPFVSIGIDVGQVALPRSFFDDFNRSDLGPRWIRYGDIGIKDGKVQYTGSAIANTTAAMVYHQPLATDIVEAGFDATIDEEDIGVGVHCPSNLSNGVWITADVGGVRIQTGAYGSRTDRDTAPVPGSGHYTIRVIRDEGDTHFIYQGFFGDPNAEGAVPVVTWADTGNTVPAGIGRRWVGKLARRNGLIYPSGRGDNWAAADITTTEET